MIEAQNSGVPELLSSFFRTTIVYLEARTDISILPVVPSLAINSSNKIVSRILFMRDFSSQDLHSTIHDSALLADNGGL